MTLKLFSPSIVLFHNHPSGNLKPSEQDMLKKIRSAGEIDIKIPDHIIIGIEDHFSFADNGYKGALYTDSIKKPFINSLKQL
ncbi:MAG: hypothetical protein IPQ19_17450 [Bacteroidetes bacterium]|nr:hypothetical protein [Bacteroidota bacterium]